MRTLYESILDTDDDVIKAAKRRIQLVKNIVAAIRKYSRPYVTNGDILTVIKYDNGKWYWDIAEKIKNDLEKILGKKQYSPDYDMFFIKDDLTLGIQRISVTPSVATYWINIENEYYKELFIKEIRHK